MIVLSSSLADGSYAQPDQPDGHENTLTVLFPPKYRTHSFLHLQIPLLDATNTLRLLQVVKDAVDEDASAIWKVAKIETAFWNFVYQLPLILEDMTDDEGAWVSDVVEDIRTRVWTTSAPGKRTGAVLDICFPPEVQERIGLLREALEINDVNVISVRKEHGPACQARCEMLDTEVSFLQDWLRRQFVLLELEWADWDYEGSLIAQFTHWTEALDDVTYEYEKWLDDLNDQDTHDDGDPSADAVETEEDGDDDISQPEEDDDDDTSQPEEDEADDDQDIQTPPHIGDGNSQKYPEYVQIDDMTCLDLSSVIHIIKPTDEGYFSTVYQGALSFNGMSELVAVKVLHSRDLEPEVMYRRFRREMHVWAAMEHANILPIYGVLVGLNDLPALVSPWCSDGNLTEYINARRNSRYPVISLCLDLLEQVLSAVKYLHEQRLPIIHGDLKGKNILIACDGRLQLCDFGLSVVHAQHGGLSLMSTDPAGRGTLPFMSPELVNGERPTVHSDMWALSCVFVEMVSGFPPYHDKPNMPGIIMAIYNGELPARPDGLSDGLWNLISTNWNQEPIQRLSAHAMLSRICSLRGRRLAGEPDSHRNSVIFVL